jgi:hypothetical protein
MRFFLACFAVFASISLASSTYFRGDPERAKYSFLIALVLSLLLALSHFFMIRGRSWGVRAIVVFYLVCLFIVLPTYGYRPHPVAYVTGLLFPLLGLLLLNSKNAIERCVKNYWSYAMSVSRQGLPPGSGKK